MSNKQCAEEFKLEAVKQVTGRGHAATKLGQMCSITLKCFTTQNVAMATMATLLRQSSKSNISTGSTVSTKFGAIQTIRMRRARGLLEQSKMSVDDIAAAVGYRDATALRRMMRKVTGNTPRQYRRSSSV